MHIHISDPFSHGYFRLFGDRENSFEELGSDSGDSEPCIVLGRWLKSGGDGKKQHLRCGNRLRCAEPARFLCVPRELSNINRYSIRLRSLLEHRGFNEERRSLGKQKKKRKFEKNLRNILMSVLDTFTMYQPSAMSSHLLCCAPQRISETRADRLAVQVLRWLPPHHRRHRL